MPEVPECLQRRFRILDDLIRGISDMPDGSQAESMDPGVRLMCNFWSILKDDPDCNLPEEVQNCFPAPSVTNSEHSTHLKPMFNQPVLQCYMAKCPLHTGCAPNDSPPPPPPDQARPATQTPPLNKVLNNLKTAASFDNKCGAKLKELLAAEKYLKAQISRLEQKEKEGVGLMKEADEMWLGMEDSYKERIADSMERQNSLMKQLQDIERSAAKWRKNRLELESQLGSLNKCQLEMVEKINQKANDLKSIDNEIVAYKKRIENTKKEAEATKSTMAYKKKASDGRLANIAKEITNIENMLREETKIKNNMEEKGRFSVAEAREDLQKICRTLLQRRLEEEDLKAEKKALIEEIDALKETCDHCRDRCAKKQKGIADEIKQTEIDIQNFVLKCSKCSKCVDSRDVRTLCIDCPRCQEYRECLVNDNTCKADPTEECVCSKVKKIFLNNVFENMSTVLEKKVRTNTGKLLGGEILKCLKKSTNAKLNDRTRKMLQEFVLQTVKKNLNLTIVGGACKTRCELDADTYSQLMLCLKGVKPTPPPKATKGTNAKKEPCLRWGGTTECHCPKGPEKCICTRKAPPSVKDPKTCPPEPPKDPAETILCPHTNEPCGPDCGAHDTFDMDRVGADVAEFRPDACSPDVCTFGKNMRAAQCVLGPEPLKSPGPDPLAHEDQLQSRNVPVKPCPCGRGTKQLMSGILKCPAFDGQSKPIKYTLSGEHPWDKYRQNDDIKGKICPGRSLSPIYKTIKRVKREPSGVCADDYPCVKHLHDTAKLVDSILHQDDTSKFIDTDSKNSSNNLSHVSSNIVDGPSKKNANINPFLIQSKLEIDGLAGTNSIKLYSEDIYSKITPSVAASIVDDFTDPVRTYRKSSDSIEKNINKETSLDEYKKELQWFYENKTYIMNIDFIAENGDSTEIETFIQKTSSGNLALDVSIINSIGVMSSTEIERPVLLRRTPSGNYRLFLGYHASEDNNVPNAVLRKTPSNGLIVVITEPIMDSMTKDLKPNMRNNEFYKVILSGISRDEMLPPATLRSTPSNNYLLVFDKEFEKKYMDALNTTFDKHGECFVELQKSNSSITIHFDKNSKKNAVLVKTRSDNIKILVNGPIFEQMSQKVFKKDKNLNAFADLMRRMPSMNQKNSDRKPPINSKTEASYKSLNQKIFLITGTSAQFKKTGSGQYEALLDEESQNSLSKHLETPTLSSQNRFPIKITDSGKIAIVLNNHNDNDQSCFGLLKITSSGNLYIVIDEKVLKEIKEKEKYCLEFGSAHMIGKVKYPKIKSTTTSDCISTIEDCLCESDERTGCKRRHTHKESCCWLQKDLDSFYLSESLYRYEDKCLSRDIFNINSLCKKLTNGGPKKDSTSRSSLKTVSFGSDSFS